MYIKSNQFRDGVGLKWFEEGGLGMGNEQNLGRWETCQ